MNASSIHCKYYVYFLEADGTAFPDKVWCKNATEAAEYFSKLCKEHDYNDQYVWRGQVFRKAVSYAEIEEVFVYPGCPDFHINQFEIAPTEGDS